MSTSGKPTSRTSSESLRDVPALRNFLSGMLHGARKQTGIPGLAIAVRSADLAIGVSTGLMTSARGAPLLPGGRFQIGCVAKLLTAAVVAQLISERILDIEAPVAHYLRELSRTQDNEAIQVKHLLSHTSGYAGPGSSAPPMFRDPTVAAEEWWPRFVEFFRQTPQRFEPGTVFSYEHTEHVVLGEIVRRVTGRDIVDHYRARILGPLGICTGMPGTDAAEFAVAEHEYCASTAKWKVLETLQRNVFWRASVSDCTLSVGDLCKLAGILLGGTHVGLGCETSTFWCDPVVRVPVAFGGGIEMELLPQGFGFVCAIFRGGVLGHNGSVRGQVCGLRADPVRNIAVAVALSANQPILRDRLLERVIEYLRAESLPTSPAIYVPVDPGELVGRYLGPQGTQVTVRRAGPQLVAEPSTAGNDSRMSITFDVSDGNKVARSKEFPTIPMCFFLHPRTGEVGMMLAMKAFRKENVGIYRGSVGCFG